MSSLSSARVGQVKQRASEVVINVDGATKGVGGVNPLMPASLYGCSFILHRLEWYQLDRIGGEIRSVALVFRFGSAVFNVV